MDWNQASATAEARSGTKILGQQHHALFGAAVGDRVRSSTSRSRRCRGRLLGVPADEGLLVAVGVGFVGERAQVQGQGTRDFGTGGKSGTGRRAARSVSAVGPSTRVRP